MGVRGYSYKKAICEILVFNLVVVDTQSYAWNRIVKNSMHTHTRTHTQVQVKLG